MDNTIRQENFNTNLAYSAGLYKGFVQQLLMIADQAGNDMDHDECAEELLKYVKRSAPRLLKDTELIWDNRYEKQYSEILNNK